MEMLLSISVMSPPSLWHILLYSLCSYSKCVIFVVFSNQEHVCYLVRLTWLIRCLTEGKTYHDFTTFTLLYAAVSPHFIHLIKINRFLGKDCHLCLSQNNRVLLLLQNHCLWKSLPQSCGFWGWEDRGFHGSRAHGLVQIVSTYPQSFWTPNLAHSLVYAPGPIMRRQAPNFFLIHLHSMERAHTTYVTWHLLCPLWPPRPSALPSRGKTAAPQPPRNSHSQWVPVT